MAEIMRALLDAYQPIDEREANDVERVRVALAGGDAWSRSAPLHVTGSALILHPPTGRVLLRWHPHMQRWMQVGGHFDAGEFDPWAVAQREAREETGLVDLAPLPSVGMTPIQVVIVPVPARADEPAHEHADFRFLFATNAPDAARAETADAALRWLPLAAASDEVVEDNLREFLRRAAGAM